MPPPDEPDVDAIAEAIADGAPVDWPASHESTVTRKPPAPLRELQIIAAIAAAHRHALEADEPAASLGDVLAAAPLTSPAAPTTVGERWGPLIVHERVGGGSFGNVYRAWDPVLDHEVALKRLSIPPGTPRAKVAELVHEGQMLAKVRHENVIMVHGACEFGGEVGIWMEFVRGRTLEQIVTGDGPLSGDEATVFGKHLCRALAAVHRAGLLHRDIKAANVMREAGGRIVMLDFGAGAEISPAGDAAGVVGTPLYMAPELFEGGTATKRSDVYSLGVLLFYLVTGQYPVQGKTLKQIRDAHREDRRQQLFDRRADLPGRFAQAVERAMSADPDERYAGAGSMLHTLTAEAETARRVPRIVPIAVAVFLTATVGFWLVGWLTTLTFNATIGRIGEFGNENVFDLWRYGQRALIPPLFVLIVAALVLLAGHPVCRMLLRRPAATVRRIHWVDAACRAVTASVRSDISNAAQLLLVAQLAVATLLCWRFRAILSAITQRLSDAPYEALLPLSPDLFMADERAWFLIGVCVSMLGMVVSWSVLLRNPSRHAISPVTLGAGVTVTVLLFLLLVMPWRIMYANKHERVAFASERCYIVATQRGNVMLYCPDTVPPKTRIVPSTDPRLRREHVVESIFSPPSVPRSAVSTRSSS